MLLHCGLLEERSTSPKNVLQERFHEPMCDSVRTGELCTCSDGAQDESSEMHMYIGGGLLGTVLLVCLIVFLVRRA
jgi:hypothetical protein